MRTLCEHDICLNVVALLHKGHDLIFSPLLTRPWRLIISGEQASVVVEDRSLKIEWSRLGCQLEERLLNTAWMDIL